MQDIVAESHRHLRRLKSKKIQNKFKYSGIFNSLSSPVEIKKIEEVKISAPKIKKRSNKPFSYSEQRELKRIQKFRNRIDTYEKQYKLSGLLTPKQIRRYKVGCRIQNIPVPEYIETLYKGIVSKKSLKKKKERKERREARRAKKKQKPSKSNKYTEYITSALWENRKNRLFQEFPRICVVCSSTKRIVVHHLKYDSREYGNERNEDLAIICWICHGKFHKKYGVKKECYEDFNKFIEDNKTVDKYLFT